MLKKRGRVVDKALMRATVNKKMQTFSHKRLAKDYAEILKEKIPTVGVVARPLEDDLFTWHANIRGPEKTPYDGGVFHLELKLPASYPNHPPTVKLFTTLPHPNVFDNFVCLDMLRVVGSQEQGGWTSAYSVQSILTQLQSFLFEDVLSTEDDKLEIRIKKAVKEANGFQCEGCSHGGKLSCWPQFSPREQPDDFVTLEEENDLLRREHLCFHTKLAAEESQLGLGLSISKVPRTGGIREAETHFDYISVKAFLKESVRTDSSYSKITHWLPVYFGATDNQITFRPPPPHDPPAQQPSSNKHKSPSNKLKPGKQKKLRPAPQPKPQPTEPRFQYFLKRSLSMIMTNSTRNYSADQVLEVLPKLVTTVAYHVMDKKKHPSIRLIRILTHLHSIFLYCMRMEPSLHKKAAAQIERFLADEKSRNKDAQPNLGCVMALLTALDAPRFADVVDTYFKEQLDRQVLWILKAVPQLLDQSLAKEADKNRIDIVFKSQMTSFHILCFYKLFLTDHCYRRKNTLALLEEYEAGICRFSTAEENNFQEQIKHISEKVVDFNSFFQYVGLKPKTQPQLLAMLKQAINNSAAKKYHGQFEVVHELEKSEIQFQKLALKVPSYKKYIDVKQEGKQFVYREQIASEADWKKLCAERWTWVREALAHDANLTSDKLSSSISFKEAKKDDRLSRTLVNQYLRQGIDYRESRIKLPSQNWKQLFLRLDLQEFLEYFNLNPNFKLLYEKLQVCSKNNVSILIFPIVKVTNIKSGYYYFTAVCSRLTTLKHLEFVGSSQIKEYVSDKLGRAIKKGLSNFVAEKGSLQTLCFSNVQCNKDLSDCLFEQLPFSPELISLRLGNNNLLQTDTAMKYLSNVLATMKGMQEIVLLNCQLKQEQCKVLADSLMRMKQLKTFVIREANPLAQGIGAIVYNLAFSPNFLELDIGTVNLSNVPKDVEEVVVSLKKMLKISASIEVLKLNKIAGLNPNLKKQFWAAVGDCRTLRVLDVSESGDLSKVVTNVGNGIGFNAKKKGVLEYVDCRNCFSNAAQLQQLYQSMCLSEYDEESIYGDPNKLAKMIQSNYPKQYYNGLKALQLDFCANLTPNFNLAHHNKLLKKQDPKIVKLIKHSPLVSSLNLSSCQLTKNICDALVLSLDTRIPDTLSKIKVLNLSRNNISKEGIKTLCEILPHNTALEVLDISKNFIGVSGAQCLAITLMHNRSLRMLNLFNNRIGYDGVKSISEKIISNHPTLQMIELGHNRLRDKGLDSVVQAVQTNRFKKLRILGLRFNFITGASAVKALKSLCGTAVQEVYIRNNLLEESTVYSLLSLEGKIGVDLGERVKYLQPERTERTIWMHPIDNINIYNLKMFLQVTYKCGIVLDIRVREGKKYPNKGENRFAFIEFAETASVEKVLSLASRKLTCVDGVRFRVFKAGTGTFRYCKKSSKQQKLEAVVPVPMPSAFNAVIPARTVQGRRQRARKQ